MRQSQVKKRSRRPRRASSCPESIKAHSDLVPRIHRAIVEIECALKERPRTV